METATTSTTITSNMEFTELFNKIYIDGLRAVNKYLEAGEIIMELDDVHDFNKLFNHVYDIAMENLNKKIQRKRKEIEKQARKMDPTTSLSSSSSSSSQPARKLSTHLKAKLRRLFGKPYVC